MFVKDKDEAQSRVAEIDPDLILLNVKMPDIVRMCRQLRADPSLSDIPLMLLTEREDRDARLLGLEAGADDFVCTPLDALEFRTRIRTMVRINGIQNAAQVRERTVPNNELKTALDGVLESWAHALELRDLETEGHTARVADMAVDLGRAVGMSGAELVHLRRGALIHDIGKMGIPDRIMFKVGVLDDDEWEVMCKHPVYAYELLSPVEYLGPALEIPYCHHEKWDGTGYPRALKGKAIPLSARVFAVVDVWDCLHSDRSYRRAWSNSRVDDYIHEQAGIHFDPDIVHVFFELLSR
jgi:putative two-component system response regulator